MANVTTCTSCGRSYVAANEEATGERRRLCFDCRDTIERARLELLDARLSPIQAKVRKLGHATTWAIIAGAG